MGYQIISMNLDLEKSWKKLVLGGALVPSLIRLYGLYQAKVQNDKPGAMKIFQILESQETKKFYNDQGFMLDISSYPNPVIVMSGN
jgi:hypothetical protein